MCFDVFGSQRDPQRVSLVGVIYLLEGKPPMVVILWPGTRQPRRGVVVVVLLSRLTPQASLGYVWVLLPVPPKQPTRGVCLFLVKEKNPQGVFGLS